MATHRVKTNFFTSTVLIGPLFIVILCLVAIPLAGAAGQDKSFEQSGIHFPGGFDLNTVGEVHGRVLDVYRPSGRGPVILTLETAWEKYAISICPPWYWDELKVTVTMGEEVRVVGSKSLGKDTNLYIIAQEMHFVEQGKSLSLRGKTGTPLWEGLHGTSDLQRGSGSRFRGQK